MQLLWPYLWVAERREETCDAEGPAAAGRIAAVLGVKEQRWPLDW